MRQSKSFALYALAGMAASGLTANRARADAKGDDLLRQVRATAHALAPLVGEYTATLHDKTGDTTDTNQAVFLHSGNQWRGGGILPQSVFNLFDPITQIPAPTRYLGRKSMEGETYDVVEIRQTAFTIQCYVGSDSLIHYAHITADTPMPLADTIPNAGRPERRPTERVAPSAKPDAGSIDVVVTSYHKARLFPARPELPAPLQSLSFFNPKSDKPRRALYCGLSPDGMRVAIAFTDETVQIFAVGSGALLTTLDTPPHVRSLVFSPDGRRLATSGDEQFIILWDAQSGRSLLALTDVNSAVLPVFTPDGKRVTCAYSALGEEPDHLIVWNTQSGQVSLSPAVKGAVRSAFSPDGRRMATLSRQADDKTLLMLWDTADWKLLHTEQIKAGRQAQPVYSPDGQWIALSGQNSSVLLFSGAAGTLQRELAGAAGDVALLQFAGSGKTLVGVDSDRRGDTPTNLAGVVVWDTKTWQVIGAGSLPFGMFVDAATPLRVAADGRSFAAFEISGGVRVWALPGR